MAVNKERKGEILKELEKIFAGASTLVFATFDKMTVAESSAMRRAMRAAGVDFTVAKKSLIGKTLKETTKWTGEAPALPGQIGIAYSTDMLSPAREVFSAGIKFDKKISILGGVFENIFRSKGFMDELATIPSRTILLGQLLGLLTSPMRGLTIALSEVAERKL